MANQTKPAPRVLLTDYAWSDLDLERTTLGTIDAELVVAHQQDEATLAELANDVDAIMTCWAKVTRAVIDATTNCQIVARLGIGLDNIDVARCTERGIVVTNVPAYCVREVAEHAIALMFALARNIAQFHQETKRGVYDLQSAPPIRRIAGQTFGIVGLGQIGREVARLAAANGLRVIATTRTVPDDLGDIAIVPLGELLRESDFVSLHLPLTAETKHLIDAAALEHMKPTAFLINTARGGLVDHEALADALQRQAIAGAALDVQDPEPPDLSEPPYGDSRVIVTPHAAFVSIESVEDLRRRATQQVVDRLSGVLPQHVINPSVLE